MHECQHDLSHDPKDRESKDSQREIGNWSSPAVFENGVGAHRPHSRRLSLRYRKRVGDAVRMDEKPVCVDAIGRAGDERAQILARLDAARPLRIARKHGLRLKHLVLVSVCQRVQDKDVASLQVVELVEHARLLHPRMRGKHAVRRKPSHGKRGPGEVADTYCERLVGGAMVYRLAQGDLRNLYPAYGCLVVPAELLFVGCDVGGVLPFREGEHVLAPAVAPRHSLVVGLSAVWCK